MRIVIIITIIAALLAEGCSRNQKKQNTPEPDNFITSLSNIEEIAVIRQITDSQSDYFPYFSADTSKVCFTRVFKSKSDDPAENEAKPFLYDIFGGDLYMASTWPEQVEIMPTPNDKLPNVGDELPLLGYTTERGIFLNAGLRGLEKNATIYLIHDSSLCQLIPGYKAAFLESISPSGKYAAITYDNRSPKLIVYDSENGRFYGFKRNVNDQPLYEITPAISSNGRYLVLNISDGSNRLNNDLLGNIWLLEFKKPDKN